MAPMKVMSDERWIFLCDGDATMLATENMEELICTLAEMDRATLIDQFISFRSRFPVDLTADYLATLDEEKIRHVFLAMCLQNKRIPEIAAH